MSISGQIVSEIVAQLYSEYSIQTLLIFFGSTQKNLEGFVISEISFLWRHSLVLYRAAMFVFRDYSNFSHV